MKAIIQTGILGDEVEFFDWDENKMYGHVSINKEADLCIEVDSLKEAEDWCERHYLYPICIMLDNGDFALNQSTVFMYEMEKFLEKHKMMKGGMICTTE